MNKKSIKVLDDVHKVHEEEPSEENKEEEKKEVKTGEKQKPNCNMKRTILMENELIMDGMFRVRHCIGAGSYG